MVERSLDQSGQLKRGSHLYERYLSLPARAQLRHSSLHAAQWLNTHLYSGAGQPAIILTSVCAACLLSPQKNPAGGQTTDGCENVRSTSFLSLPGSTFFFLNQVKPIQYLDMAHCDVIRGG